MADNQRIEDLRRRVHKDPASIAFAQLAEECRRAGHHQEAVDVCRAGLAIHPGYLSARVTLGRALIELNDLDTALGELTVVLKGAPENLAAIRGVAEIHHRRGELAAALAQYRAALALARNDPDLQQTVSELARQIEPPLPPASADGLSFEQMRSEFLAMAPPPARPAPVEATPSPAVPASAAQALSAPKGVDATPTEAHRSTPLSIAVEPSVVQSAPEPAAEPAVEAVMPVEPVTLTETAARVEPPPAREAPAASTAEETAIDEPALQTIAALEQWIDAIHVARADRGA